MLKLLNAFRSPYFANVISPKLAKVNGRGIAAPGKIEYSGRFQGYEHLVSVLVRG